MVAFKYALARNTVTFMPLHVKDNLNNKHNGIKF